MRDRNQIVARALQQPKNGWHVTLDSGIPTLVSDDFSNAGRVTVQSKNGMLRTGPVPIVGAGFDFSTQAELD